MIKIMLIILGILFCALFALSTFLVVREGIERIKKGHIADGILTMSIFCYICVIFILLGVATLM